jgi:superfamily II DNA/RNA helicase
MGGMTEDRTEVIGRFRDDPNIRILLSSEVASEGVDLQFCRVLVDYDLPWNPMKVEQRIGRIDRLGQVAEKNIILNLVYAGTIDAHRTASLRTPTIDNALKGGDKFDLRLNRMSTSTVEKIVEANFPNIDQSRRYRYCQLAEGYLRFAIFLCDRNETDYEGRGQCDVPPALAARSRSRSLPEVSRFR